MTVRAPRPAAVGNPTTKGAARDQANFDRVLEAFCIARGPRSWDLGDLFLEDEEEEELAA